MSIRMAMIGAAMAGKSNDAPKVKVTKMTCRRCLTPSRGLYQYCYNCWNKYGLRYEGVVIELSDGSAIVFDWKIV